MSLRTLANSLLVFGWVMHCPLSAYCQTTAAWWVVPPNTIKLSLGPENEQRKVSFHETGMGYEVQIPFAMINKREIKLEVALPDAGEFDVRLLTPDSKLKISDVKVADSQGTAKFSATYASMSRNDIQKQARTKMDKLLEPEYQKGLADSAGKPPRELRRWLQDHGVDAKNAKDEQLRPMYARQYSLEKGKDLILEGLKQLVTRRPKWTKPKDVEAWEKGTSKELYPIMDEFFGLEIAGEHLESWALEFDSNHPNFKKLLENRIEALQLIVTGKAAENPAEGKRIAEAFTSGEIATLRKALTAVVAVRLTPATDERDPNSKWINAQRVVCRVPGVAVVRVEGTLDPKQSDSVDWWLLDRYIPDETVLSTSKTPGVRFDEVFLDESGAKLRVVATGEEKVDYWFEIRLSKTTYKLNIQLHESPGSTNLKFPY